MDIYSWDVISLVRYGSQWRRSRRLFHEFFNAKAVTTFDGHQRKCAYRFLSRLAQTPDKFLDHAKLCVSFRMRSSWTLTRLTLILPSVIGALVMEITYGMEIKSHEDKFLQTSEHALEYIERVMVPGAFLVDTFPIRPFILSFLGPCALLIIYPEVKHIPEWFPGAGFKRFAKEGGRLFGMAVVGPLEWVKESLKVSQCGPRGPLDSWTDVCGKSNGSNASIASSCFDRVAELQNQGFNEDDVRAVTATTYIGEASSCYRCSAALPD
jgi:hypothetical protein